MEDLGYKTEDYSEETPIQAGKPKKMKTVYPTLRLHKTVPEFIKSAKFEQKIKLEIYVEVTGINKDKEYGDGRDEVTLSVMKMKKLANTSMTKEEYLKSDDEDRDKHNKERMD